jgi:hypothetical protein
MKIFLIAILVLVLVLVVVYVSRIQMCVDLNTTSGGSSGGCYHLWNSEFWGGSK